MESLKAPMLRDYAAASAVEWIDADGAGGISASSVLNANTRKQHALLSVLDDQDRRVVLVASLQETVVDGARSFDLATNAYFGTIHPEGYLALESFTDDPWPTWRYDFDGLSIIKQVVHVNGENTVIVVYTVVGTDRPVSIEVRPLLAFRDQHRLRSERLSPAKPWAVSRECIECMPFAEGPALYIAHPEATVETISLWYRGFMYERDRESHVECAEDLYHPGYIAMTLEPDQPRPLLFSTPSPRPISLAEEYLATERSRRAAISRIPDAEDDPFFRRLLRAADVLTYETIDGWIDVYPGLPWGEGARWRGLIGFAGLLLPRKRFDTARQYLEGVARAWQVTQAPSRFEPYTLAGQMHPADVPLWFFVAVWRYWKASDDSIFVGDVLLPTLESIANYYVGMQEVRCTLSGLIEVGYERNAGYAPTLPLGTNALWHNAQAILAELFDMRGDGKAARWRERAARTAAGIAETFPCEGRPGFADAVRLEPFWRDESLRAGQVLALGLPFLPVDNAAPVVESITRELATPYGLRTLSKADSRYLGKAEDISAMPKIWSGSVDATWFGCYCDALRRTGVTLEGTEWLKPFEAELNRRGYGQISGAFSGDAPHTPCDCLASSSALGELMRIYAREILRLPHMVW